MRVLVGDYLYISDPAALRRLHGWMEVVKEDEDLKPGQFEARLAEIQCLPYLPESFHPKAWRILDDSGGMLVVGSSNLSRPALETGIEWNLVSCFALGDSVEQSLKSAFTNLWGLSTTLTSEVAERYSIFAKKAREFSRRYLLGTSNCDSTSNLTVKYLATRLRRWKSGLPGGLNGRSTGGLSSNGDENGFGAMVNVSSLQLNVQRRHGLYSKL